MRRTIAAALALVPLLAACAAQQVAVAPPAPADTGPKPVWAFEKSDVPVDPAYRFGQLPNGMRYVIRHNATPAGTAIVRMDVAAGSLDESDAEQGYAHFVEHMAFNGSTHVPEGDMIRILEREGLAFGADTNAFTSFEQTRYKLDLPRNDPALLDLALMLMRETASELTFAPDAVARERGVVLSEMRDRNTYGWRNTVDSIGFFDPGALFSKRFAIGKPETLDAATSESLKAFWHREYVPEHTTLVVIGDFDPALVEAQIVRHFADWKGAPVREQPGAGPVDFADKGRTEVYVDPALTERVEADRNGPWLHEPDTIAQRQQNLLRQIGYAIVDRRFQRMSRLPSPPFRGAGFGTGDIFKAGRATRLIVDTPDRKWRAGLVAAVKEYRRALKYGFTDAEVAEQVANIRSALENAAASADTRSNESLDDPIWSLIDDDMVPSDPRSTLQRFDHFVPNITPAAVLTALKFEALPLKDPLLRFRGRIAPVGGEKAIRDAWNEAVHAHISGDSAAAAGTFAYTDFGTPGKVVSDIRDPQLGIREVRFANGVMLNVKHTDLDKDRVSVRVSLDGGDMLNTKADPFVTQLVPYIAEGGLGKHSEDDLQSILAGHTVSDEFKAEDAYVSASSDTTARDLGLQLDVFAAYMTDPGYRGEGLDQYRESINRYFAQLSATPHSAMSGSLGGIVSDKDPRFTLQPVDDYRRLTYQELAKGMADKLAHGAIEIGIVGDVDEDQAIAQVARTFGALPPRAQAFDGAAGQPPRTFTADRSRRIVRHDGPKDQALIRLMWPTRDDSDEHAALVLSLLDQVADIQLTETLREQLGKTYSPGASSSMSRYWPGYGTFTLGASVKVSDVAATEAAMLKAVRDLRDKPVSDDIIRRARQPMLEHYQNALKSNAGWLALAAHAQGEPGRIALFERASDELAQLTAADLKAAADKWLDPATVLEILALPEGVDPPASGTGQAGLAAK